MRKLQGRVVVITGGGSGIGRATAHAFAKVGATVHVADLHRSRADETAGELRLLEAEAYAHHVDVREPEAVETLAQDVYDRSGRCDILINNAGVGHSGLVQETSLEDWKWVLDVNLWGVIHGIHSFVPRIIDQGGDAHIVNIASFAGLVGVPSMAPYCTSKFAVVGLSETLGTELAPYGIAVTAVCPGLINTDIIRAGRVQGRVEGAKRRVERMFERFGMPPERVARDIVAAVRRRKPLQLTLGTMYPALLLRRLSPRLFRASARLAQGRFMRKGTR